MSTTLFLFGLLVGSFLNVVIFRIEREESYVGGRSRCLSCGHELYWYDNIPLLSFFWLRGKCRFCRASLSWQYPLVELTTGILFASCSFFIRELSVASGVILLWLLVTVAFLILITVYDLRFSLIPNSFLWSINTVAIIFLCWNYFFTPSLTQAVMLPGLESSLWGAVVIGGFFWLLVFLSRETWMGYGDVWLGFWAGMVVGIELAQFFITLAFGLGAMVGVALLYTKKKTMKAEIPFAPYILMATVLIFVAMRFYPTILAFLSPWLPATIGGE
jgi:leader peptidase (prepilin peptidase) / N-methyltransferase